MELSQQQAREILRNHCVDIAPEDPRSVENIATQLLEYGTSTLLGSTVEIEPVDSNSIET